MEKTFKRFFTILSIMLVAAIVLLAVAVPCAADSDRKIDIFGTENIAENIRNLEMNMTSVIYVKDDFGKWVEYQRLHGDENRLWIGIDKMPKNLINAFIAIEDETFREHSGINWKRTMGAVGNYIFKFDDTEFGGSTMTQQLIKNITSDNSRTAGRKLREIVRALILETKLSKNQILEAYLNTIALGNGICGVKVASEYYFNKSVDELSLVECACLAAITKNPSKFNPVTGAESNTERRRLVFDKMLELGFITKEEYDAEYNSDIVLDDSQKEDYEAEINNYFVDALIDDVIGDLAEKYNCSEDMASTMLYNGGFKIYATIDTGIQEIMEKAYANTDKYFYLKGKNLQGETVHLQSAMTIMDYSGHIVGIVGGAGEKTVNRGLNRATDAPRQPGSTMKPLGVYALAVEKDLVHYSSKVVDKPIDNYYPDGKKGPREWYGYYKGTITLDYAIRKSANTIPAKLLLDIGVDESYNFLTKKLGLKHLIEGDKNLSSLALGGCHYGVTTTESAGAYAIFGNNGVYHEPTTYYKVEKTTGETVLQYDESGEQVITPATATIMNHLLQGVVYGSEGTGSGIRWYNTMKAYAKTGTSSESKDLWMVAGTPYYVGSVWCGFDMQQEIKSTSIAATLWKDIMKEIHTGLPKKEFVDSEDVYKKGSGYYKEGSKPDNYSTIGNTSSTASSVSSNTVTSDDMTSSNVSGTGSDSSGTESNSSGTQSGEDPPDSSGDTTTEPSGGDENVSSDTTSGTASTPTQGTESESEPNNPQDPVNQE